VSGVFALALLIAGVLSLAKHGELASAAPATAFVVGGDLKEYGILLFTKYLLPVEVTGFLLLIAMLGVAVLSRKQAEETGVRSQNLEARSQELETRSQNSGARSQDLGGSL